MAGNRDQASDLKNESFELKDLQTRIYGNMAIVIGQETTKSSYQGNPAGGNFRVTLVLVRQNDAWHLANSQLSKFITTRR